jgi:hypothetical protein
LDGTAKRFIEAHAADKQVIVKEHPDSIPLEMILVRGASGRHAL